MNKTYIKNILRDMKTTKGKVFSILIMVLLATMVIVGLNLTGPSMRESLDHSLKEYTHPDITIKSTYPLDYEDEILVKKDPDIRDISLVKTIDLKSDEDIIRLKSLDPNFPKLIVTEGRLPDNNKEIILDKAFKDDYNLSDKISYSYINEGQEESNKLKNTEFEIVGFFRTSDKFMEDMKEISPLGKKEISGLAYIYRDNFLKDEFDEIDISFKQTKGLGRTSDEYINFVKEKKEDLESLFFNRPKEVLSDIKEDAGEKIGDAEKDLDDAKDKLSESERKLKDAKKDIDEGFRKYEEEKENYYIQINNAQNELSNARANLEAGQLRLDDAKDKLSLAKEKYNENIGPLQKKLDDNYLKLVKGQEEIDKSKDEINKGLEEIDKNYQKSLSKLESIKYLPDDSKEEDGPNLIYYDKIAKENEELSPEDAGLEGSDNKDKNKEDQPPINPIYEQKKQDLDSQTKKAKEPLLMGLEEISLKERELSKAWQDYDRGLKEFEDMKNSSLSKINSGQEEIDTNQAEINSGWTSYYQGLDSLKSSKDTGRKKLEDAYNKLVDSKLDYEQGLKEFKDEKPSALEDISEGEEKIEDEKQALLKLRDPEYEISTIFDNEGIDTYYQNSTNMDKLSRVFPLFFYLVAMLVTLTTMKRYIEEQRLINGSLKSLGYFNKDIAKRFYIYGLSPTILGAIIGGLLGRFLIVRVIFNAYSTGFNIVEMVLANSTLLIIGSILLSAILVAITVFISSRDTVKESPASLLNGKSPISGSKILLERIKPVWKRLSFMQKITARNLFRYKSRMFMTLFGVAGCTALIFFGFAMIDSLKDTASIQRSEIHNYDILAILDEKASEDEKTSYKDNFKDENLLDIKNEPAKLKKDGKSVDLSLVVVKELDKFDDFVNLRTSKGDPIDLGEKGAVITVNASKNLDISADDKIKLNVDGKDLEIEIGAVAENYVSDYLYMSESFYENHLGKIPEINANYIKGDPQIIGEKLEDEQALIALVNTSDAYEFMDSLLDNLNLVIVVITLVSSILASVVLYNITDVNVSERKRELATIKVLGFYPKEVTSYIYREIFILTLLGIGFGYGLGYLIFRYILLVVAPKDIILSTKLHPLSFIVSAAITLLLSLIMLVYVHNKLKKIDMAEAMSSGE